MSQEPEAYLLSEPLIRRKRVEGGAEVEETITEVTLRRPKAADLRVMDSHKGTMGQTIALIARLSGLTVGEVDRMEAYDIAELGAQVGGFLEKPKAGGTSSET